MRAHLSEERIRAHLSEDPVELHAFGGGVAALQEAWPAVDVHQALIVVVVDGGTQQADIELLRLRVVHILHQQGETVSQQCHLTELSGGVCVYVCVRVWV